MAKYRKNGGRHSIGETGPRTARLGKWRRASIIGVVAMTAAGLAVLGASTASATLSGSPYNGLDGTLDTGTTSTPDQPSGSSDNSFGQGTKENNSNVTIVQGSIPPNKNDLLHFYEASAFASGSNYLYLAWDRAVNLGNANIDFEINQKKTTDFTATKTGALTLNRTAGDLLITYDFVGSNKPIQIGLATWTGSAWTTPVTLNGTANAEASISSNGLFGEVVVNLTGAGVFQSGCKAFAAAFAKSRSSTSFTAELKDFIAPSTVDVSNCGTIVINKTALNGDATFSYDSTGGLVSPSTFTLATSGGSASRTFSDLSFTTYSVTENAGPSGWDFVSVSCSDADSSTTSSSTSGQTATIVVSGPGTATCTFTNRTKVPTSIATTLSSSSVEVGTAVHDSATLSGDTASSAGGTVTYTVYTDNACSTGAVDAGTKSVTNGVVDDSNAITFNTAGDYYWQAVYSGDTNHVGSTSTCTEEHLVVTPKHPTASTAQRLIPDDSFTLSGGSTPSGTITFNLYGPSDATCQGTPAFTQAVTVSGNGTYQTTNASQPIPFVAQTAGTWRWEDVYSGDGNNAGVTSTCGTESFTIVNS
jgi:hypothetical protein